MRKQVKRILSLTLVIAVLMTSMLVSSVGAATTPAPAPVVANPMQTVLFEALQLDFKGKTAFNAALAKAETNLDGAANDMHTLFTSMTAADAKKALEEYIALSDDKKSSIQGSVLLFTLNTIADTSSLGFPTIVSKVNTELTGDSTKNEGISLMIQVIEFLNAASRNGAWVTEVTAGDTSKIAFEYNKDDTLVKMAKDSISDLITYMDTIKGKIAGRTEPTDFDKLLGYTAKVINDSAPATEVKALKDYLYKINPDYYKIKTVVSTGGVGGGVAPVDSATTAETKAVAEIAKTAPKADAPIEQVKAYEKALDAAIQKAIAAAGTTTVAPVITGTTAKITADQIKVADILAKADAVIATAAELAKSTVGTNVSVEKKIVLAFDAKGVATVNVELPGDLFAKVQAKGITAIEITTGEVKLGVVPNFAAAAKDAKTVSFKINKVAVTDALKATMSAEQKKLLEGNATVYDFNAAMTTGAAIETKITNFDNSVKIKLKYTLKAGENKDNITVLYLADDGSIQNMVGRYDVAAGEVVFVTNHFSSFVVKSLAISFNDIATGDWYKSQAESLAAKGIVAGRVGNNFAPKANITRAEFLTMLVKAKGVYDSKATCDFTDVSKDAWYYTYVASAVKAGIAGGTSADKFAPNSLITREQMAVMIANALGVKTLDNASSYLKASDANKIAAYAKNAMALSVRNDFMVGSGNKLDPKGNATRGMAAVVVYKYFNFIF